MNTITMIALALMIVGTIGSVLLNMKLMKNNKELRTKVLELEAELIKVNSEKTRAVKTAKNTRKYNKKTKN